jgi:hypothetical protein
MASPLALVARLVAPHLGLRERLACTLVCKDWKEAADEEIVRDKMRLIVDKRVGGSNMWVRRSTAVTAYLLNPRWSRAEWVQLVYNKEASRKLELATTVVDPDMPRLQRLSVHNLRICGVSAAPRRLLHGDALRHLELVLVMDMHNFVATTTAVHAMLRVCGERLVTLSIQCDDRVRGYHVDPRIETATVRPPAAENRRVALAAYGWDTVRMPHLQRLDLGTQFAWLSLDAPRVTIAEIGEGPACLFTDGPSAPLCTPAYVRCLGSATATLRALKWVLHPRADPDDVVKTREVIAQFRALEYMEMREGECTSANWLKDTTHLTPVGVGLPPKGDTTVWYSTYGGCVILDPQYLVKPRSA